MSERDNPMQKVITKCWEDEAFKKRLLADPAAMCVWRLVGPPRLGGVAKTVPSVLGQVADGKDERCDDDEERREEPALA